MLEDTRLTIPDTLQNQRSRSTKRRLQTLCLVTGALAFGLGFLAGCALPSLYPNQTTKPVNGIYWSPYIENTLPKGFIDNDIWRKYAENAVVVSLTEGCGRMQNRLVTFADGSRSCVRYRQNTDQIQGEIFSYYLGQELGLKNLLPTTLDVVKTRTSRWTTVVPDLVLAQWSEDRPIVLTRFISQLSPAYIPESLRNESRRLHPPDVANLTDFTDLAQWSDLVVFDYLTANLDRVVNNLYNLQWNSAMMDAPAHNLAQAGNFLVFLDNESGLLHGYRLLHKYETHHSTLLDALCVYRKSTANAVKTLHKDQSIGERLKNRFRKEHPDMLDILPELPERSVQILNQRIARVHDVITRCESLYPET